MDVRKVQTKFARTARLREELLGLLLDEPVEKTGDAGGGVPWRNCPKLTAPGDRPGKPVDGCVIPAELSKREREALTELLNSGASADGPKEIQGEIAAGSGVWVLYLLTAPE